MGVRLDIRCADYDAPRNLSGSKFEDKNLSHIDHI